MQNNGVDEMLFVLLSFCIDIKAAPKTHVLIFLQVLQMGGLRVSFPPRAHTPLSSYCSAFFTTGPRYGSLVDMFHHVW